MRDYTKGQIYKIVSNQTDLTYIGSTTQPLSKRMYEHRKHYRRLGDKYTCSVKRILCYDDAHIILIETHPCASKWELERRERHFIETTNCVNLVRPAQTARDAYERQRLYEKRPEVQARRVAYKKKHGKQQGKEWRKKQDKAHLRLYDYHRKSEFGKLCRLYKCML